MKRFLGILLAVLLLCGQTLAPAAMATADEAVEAVEVAETTEAEAELEVALVTEANGTEAVEEADELKPGTEVESMPDEEVQESTGSVGTGLVVDNGEDTSDDVAETSDDVAETQDDVAETQDDAETTDVQSAPAAVTDCDYGRIAEDGADVYAQADSEAAFAKLGGRAVVLLSGERSGERAEVVFDTDLGVVTAWVNADRVVTLTGEEKQEYLDAAPADARAYEKDLNALLVRVACSFLPTETEGTTEEKTEGTTEEKTEENTEEKTEEKTEENTEEKTEETTEENTEGTTKENTEEKTEETTEENTEGTTEEKTEENTEEKTEETTEENTEEKTEENTEGTTEEKTEENAEEKAEEDTEGEGEPEEETTESTQPAANELAEGEAQESITPNFTEAQLLPGASCTIEVRDVTGARLGSPELTFTSSNASIASVNDAGTVVGHNPGIAVITAAYNEKLTCEVKIQVLGLPGYVVASPAARIIGVGEYYTGLRAVFPAGTGARVWFSSNKPRVAVVDPNTGAVYGKKKGKAVITITTSNGKQARCAITVMKAPKSVWLNTGSLTMARDGLTAQLWTGVPKKTTGGVLRWTTSNPNVATVNGNGLVTSVNPGVAYITVRTYNGHSASCRVTVTEPPETARYNSTSCSMWLGATVVPGITALDANGNPAAIHGSFRIVSANPAGCVALNAGNGAVRGVRTGTAVITFTTYNGIQSENTVTVQVFAPVKKVKLAGVKTMTVGQQFGSWAVALSPVGAYNVVTFTSNKPSVLRVLNARTGLVQALKKGTATITVRAHNGKKSKIKVKVKAAPVQPAPRVTTIGFPNVPVIQNTPVSEASVQKINAILDYARSKLNKPYVYGGGYTNANPSGYDCSGLVYACYYHTQGIKLGASAYLQGYDGNSNYGLVKDVRYLQPGDIVCFNTSSDSDWSDHTGIYIGNGYFVHASSSGGKVMVSQIGPAATDYYYRNFSWARRVFMN